MSILFTLEPKRNKKVDIGMAKKRKEINGKYKRNELTLPYFIGFAYRSN